jgi:hypothetical protein
VGIRELSEEWRIAKREIRLLLGSSPFSQSALTPFSLLAELHQKPGQALFAGFGWSSSLTDAEVLERLLALNHERAASQGQRAARRPADSMPLVEA